MAVLGAAFKPDSDDVRDSPALDVAAAVQPEGGRVRVYDPQAMANARRAAPASWTTAPSLADACAGADLVCCSPSGDEFRDMDPDEIGALVARRNIVDGRIGPRPGAVARPPAGPTARLGRP